MKRRIFQLITLLTGLSLTSPAFTQQINNEISGRVYFGASPYEPLTINGALTCKGFWCTPAIWYDNRAYIYEQDKISKPYFNRYVDIMQLDSIILPDSTFMIGYGYDPTSAIASRNGRIPSMTSFEIKEMPQVGDSARFQFCFITTTHKTQRIYSPVIFFSESIDVDKDNNITNLATFVEFGHLQLERLPNGLALATITLEVTPAFARYRWLHLRNTLYEDMNDHIEAGFIVPFYLWKLNSILASGRLNEKVSFEPASYTLSDNERLQLSRLVEVARHRRVTFHLSPGLVTSMNESSSDFYASLRMEGIRQQLTTLGIDEQAIVIDTPSAFAGSNEIGIVITVSE